MNAAWPRQHGRYRPMIPIQNSEVLTLVDADQDHSTQAGILLDDPVAYLRDLRHEWAFHDIFSVADAPGNFGDRKIAARDFSPVRPRKDPNLGEVPVPHFHLIPLRSSGKFVPQSKMPNEEQSAPLRAFANIFIVRLQYNFPQLILV